MIKSPAPARASLQPVFQPRSVAVVGASPSSRWGRQTLENFTLLNFPGQVAAINPKYPEILGYPCFPSLREMPWAPEAVCISVNRERVVEVVEEAAEVGAKAAVIFAIGFAEAGEEGRKAQQRLRDIADRSGMAVIGPNCQGVINFVQPMAMYMDVVNPYEPGSVALFAQSGSVTTALANSKRGVRWSHVVSCGNEAVSGAADLIGYYVDDPQVRVICGFIETIRNPEHFVHQCDRAREAGKPVIILKSGRSEAGRLAATAHSGALSAPDRLYDELLKRHGVLRVDSSEQLLETAIALQSRRLPAGGRIAALTGSGGQIELTLDETGKYPVLSHPEFEPATKTFLRGELPDFLATSNPLDYWGITDFIGAYPRLLKALADDPNIDIVVGVAGTNHGPTGQPSGEYNSIEAAAELAKTSTKLFAVITPTDGEPPPALVEASLARDVLLLSGFEEGYRALERLVTYARPAAPTAAAPGIDRDAIEAILDARGSRPFSGEAALEVLALAGIATAGSVAVAEPDEAADAASRLGFPVVVKTGDADALHKTESGGVILNLDSAERVRTAAKLILAAGARSVLVQKQVVGGVELILGLKTDPSLGTFVLAGLGGIWTEVLNDVAIRPAGLVEGEAAAMVDELRSRRLLEGVRGAAPADKRALVDAIARMDALARAFGPRLEAIDVNPLLVLPEGVVAVDALIVPRP